MVLLPTVMSIQRRGRHFRHWPSPQPSLTLLSATGPPRRREGDCPRNPWLRHLFHYNHRPFLPYYHLLSLRAFFTPPRSGQMLAT